MTLQLLPSHGCVEREFLSSEVGDLAGAPLRLRRYSEYVEISSGV